MSAAPGVLRILGLVTEAYAGTGGISQYNSDFYDALCRLPAIDEVVLLPRRVQDAVQPTPRSLRVETAREGRSPYAVAALHLALKVRPHTIVCGHLFMAPLAAFIAERCGSKLVVQLHGIEIWQEPGALRRRALQRADLVLCVSRDTRARVLAGTDLPPEKIVVLPNTVAEEFVPSESRASSLGSPLRLLSVGRLDARETYKGYDRVIACLPELRRRGRDVVYEIAGEGDDRLRLERLARTSGVADRVRFLGRVPRDKLPDLYRAADLFVLASQGEGFGIVFLEAMACGTPALGLACGGAVDALDGLGRAVSADRLTDAIAEALDDAVTRGSIGQMQDLAARVRARFGRPVFEANVAQAVARLGIEMASVGCAAAGRSEQIGVAA